MPLTDMTLAELRRYQPERNEPVDFDAFWAETLKLARQHPMTPTFTPVATPITTVDVLDVTFPGYAGQPVRGWLMLPKHAGPEPLPCVVTYIGYGGGRGKPHEYLLLASSGYAQFVMDTRGQGSGWKRGDTPDTVDGPVDPQVPGFMTRGIASPHSYYYRRVITDAVRAVEAARSHPRVDATRVAVAGGSQGGGLALAVAGLADGLAAVASDVPFLCHYQRALEIVSNPPYTELVSYLAVHRDTVESTFHTLSYMDGVNFAARATAPAVISVALMDPTCPPSTVFAAHHHYAGPKELVIWPFNGHEGGGSDQEIAHLDFYARTLH